MSIEEMDKAVVKMLIHSAIWFAIGIAIMLIIILCGITAYKQMKAEKDAYERMIFSINDNTVSDYINIFSDTHNNLILRFTKRHLLEGYEGKIRCAQGYAEVVQSPYVSQALKDELRTVMLLHGVPIDM